MRESLGMPQTDEQPGLMRRGSCHHGTTFSGQNRNRRRGIGIKPTPCAYRKDANKKDQGWALLDEGSTPPVPSEDGETYKTLSN
jgi:hypothetical protein